MHAVIELIVKTYGLKINIWFEMSILQDCDFLKGPFTYLGNLKVNKIAYKPLLLVLLIIDNF